MRRDICTRHLTKLRNYGIILPSAEMLTTEKVAPCVAGAEKSSPTSGTDAYTSSAGDAGMRKK